jgi:hypothetical protein
MATTLTDIGGLFMRTRTGERGEKFTTESYEFEDIIAERDIPLLMWSDTPVLGVGDSRDTDGVNFCMVMLEAINALRASKKSDPDYLEICEFVIHNERTGAWVFTEISTHPFRY